jgi:hypothetical protein
MHTFLILLEVSYLLQMNATQSTVQYQNITKR